MRLTGLTDADVADKVIDDEAAVRLLKLATFGFELPGTVSIACVGRLLDEVVDHEAWRGRGWRIAAIAEEDYPWGERLIAATGAVEYRMPWARQRS